MPNWHLVGKMWQIAKLVHLSAICLYGRNDRDPAIGPFSAYFVVKTLAADLPRFCGYTERRGFGIIDA